jgi:hypothetical protein
MRDQVPDPRGVKDHFPA